MKERLIMSALVTGGIGAAVDRGRLEQEARAAIEPVLRKFNLSINKLVVEDDIVIGDLEGESDEVPMTFDGSIAPD